MVKKKKAKKKLLTKKVAPEEEEAVIKDAVFGALETVIERDNLETEVEHMEPEPEEPRQDKPLEPMNPLSGIDVYESGSSAASKYHDNMWVAICGKCELRYSHMVEKEIPTSDGKHYTKCSHCGAVNHVPEPVDL